MIALLALLVAADGTAGACRRERAERVTFAALARDEAAWRGRCVVLRAVWSGDGLYPGHEEARRGGGARVAVRAPPSLVAGALRPGTYNAVGILRSGPLLEATEMYRRRWPGPHGRLP